MRYKADFAYAQARMQARFGSFPDNTAWLKLQNVLELGSYLQVAGQTSLRPWVLGLSAMHTSHEIERALRQKYRRQVDEVASWLPPGWQPAFRWIKCLGDLPALQYLMAGGEPLQWMDSDPDISDFTDDDPEIRQSALKVAGYARLVDAWQQGDLILTAWLSHWNRIRPKTPDFEQGLLSAEKLLRKQIEGDPENTDTDSPKDYEAIAAECRPVFRRYAFQPAAACAYLALVGIEFQRLRSELMQRLFFQAGEQPLEVATK